jgi:hypothetical protein
MEKEVEGIVVDENRAREERRFLHWLESRTRTERRTECYEDHVQYLGIQHLTWEDLEDIASTKYLVVARTGCAFCLCGTFYYCHRKRWMEIQVR